MNLRIVIGSIVLMSLLFLIQGCQNNEISKDSVAIDNYNHALDRPRVPGR